MKIFELNLTSISFIEIEAENEDEAKRFVGENLEDYMNQIQDNISIGEDVQEL